MNQPKHGVLNTLLLRRKTAVGFALMALISQLAQAQSLGINTQGNTGGLVIPYADVLAPGTFALSYGNYQEQQVGAAASTQQNMSFGIGLIPYVEFFGRFAEYTNPNPKSINVNGVRDISANIKVQIPTGEALGPKLALGVNDLSGGAVNFKSAYAVASDAWGPFFVSLGYARGQSPASKPKNPPTFDGLFGGVNVRLGDTGLSGLIEHDGQQNHVGLRWMSDRIPYLANSQVVANLQHSLNSTNNESGSKWNLSFVMPLGLNDHKKTYFQPTPEQALALIDNDSAAKDSAGMKATDQDKLESLQKTLVNMGLERVHVGTQEKTLVVVYENHRYAHNEVDALGIIFGLGAELAPKGISTLKVFTLKDGLPIYATTLQRDSYRAFLREGPASDVQEKLHLNFMPVIQAEKIDWIQAQPSSASRVRVEVKPDLNYTLGTEVGAFDYSLAANVQATAPLWSGASLYTSYLLPLDNTANLDDGNVFDLLKHRSGLKTAALQQTFWLGSHMLAHVAAGKFNYDTTGVQAQATLFVPGTDNTFHLSGATYNQAPGGIAGQSRAGAVNYRHQLSPTMWIQAGAQRYSDGSSGPSLEWNRWFGDVAVQLFYRKGGSTQFAGLELNIPLTPRQGMKPAPVFFTGAGHFDKSIRTRLTTSGSPANSIAPGAVTNLKLETSLDNATLNAGRLSKAYLDEQVYRMRESYFLFAHEKK